MFAKKKPDRPRRPRTGGNLSQFGLFDVPSSLSVEQDVDGMQDEGDSDLEAELAALASDGGSRPKRPPRKPAVPAQHLDAMVAESLKDIPSDEEVSDGEDDPDLLHELNEIAGNSEEEDEEKSMETSAPMSPSKSISNLSTLLEERLKMYETAENNAKEAGETTRARRFNRGVKTLKDLIKQASSGKNINEEDIPPEVTTHIQNVKPPIESEQPETESQSQQPSLSAENGELLKLLNTRKDEYKTAALKAKRGGDAPTAVKFIKVAKQFEMVIKAVENGQPIDLSKMPGPPEEQTTPPIPETVTTPPEPPKEESQNQTSGEPEEEQPEPDLITAGSLSEALQQRLELYKSQENAAKEQGNSSKARRMGRIVKQYEDAIKKNNAGKPIAVDELPTPPGYAPLPVEGTSSAPKPTPQPTPTPKTSPPEAPKVPSRGGSGRVANHAPTSRAEKQLAFLIARQKEFKEAALNAKRKGEMTQAKEFLRSAKGFDPLIQAAEGGFPVDIESLPVPPSSKSQLDEEYDIIMDDEVASNDSVDPEHLDILTRLEQQLTKQLRMCLTTRDHNKAIGDVAGTNRFEQLALSVTRDLDVVRLAQKTSSKAVPKFHYETKNFSVVQSSTDLNDNDLELQIIRGISYNCSNPNDVDTYVKYEFAYPQEAPVTNRTATVKNTNNPDYNEKFVLPIQRTSKSCLRYFKRHGIKFEVYSKGGFFRGDTLLGTVTVKLQPLETQCELHDSFDLMEGRKKVGGKLEIKLRVRDPLLTRQVEQLSEKWLVLDH